MWLVWQLSVCCITNNMTVYKHVNSRWARDDSHSCGWAHPFSNWLTMCYISIISTEYLRFVANKLLLSRCFTSTETIRLIRDGRRWGKREIIYMLLHCHHQNVSCIKTGSDEIHYNASLTVKDNVNGQCPQTTTFRKRRESRSKIDPRPFCLPPYRLKLGETGSRTEYKYILRLCEFIYGWSETRARISHCRGTIINKIPMFVFELKG